MYIGYFVQSYCAIGNSLLLYGLCKLMTGKTVDAGLNEESENVTTMYGVCEEYNRPCNTAERKYFYTTPMDHVIYDISSSLGHTASGQLSPHFPNRFHL